MSPWHSLESEQAGHIAVEYLRPVLESLPRQTDDEIVYIYRVPQPGVDQKYQPKLFLHFKDTINGQFKGSKRLSQSLYMDSLEKRVNELSDIHGFDKTLAKQHAYVLT